MTNYKWHLDIFTVTWWRAWAPCDGRIAFEATTHNKGRPRAVKDDTSGAAVNTGLTGAAESTTAVCLPWPPPPTHQKEILFCTRRNKKVHKVKWIPTFFFFFDRRLSILFFFFHSAVVFFFPLALSSHLWEAGDSPPCPADTAWAAGVIKTHSVAANGPFFFFSIRPVRLTFMRNNSGSALAW